MTAVLTPLLAATAAFIGSWLAARFALSRFYRERIWERRAAAYTSIFESVHEYVRWVDERIAEKPKAGRGLPTFLPASKGRRKTCQNEWLAKRGCYPTSF
jgi:hypothetical protein